jgi:hypothetical protein
LLLVEREIFSLLVFGGQDVLKEIGFVSQFRVFIVRLLTTKTPGHKARFVPLRRCVSPSTPRNVSAFFKQPAFYHGYG